MNYFVSFLGESWLHLADRAERETKSMNHFAHTSAAKMKKNIHQPTPKITKSATGTIKNKNKVYNF